jgi:hypothetical protein
MQLLLAFLFGVVLLSIWELRGGPRWRTPWVVVTCVVVSLAYLSFQRVV